MKTTYWYVLLVVVLVGGLILARNASDGARSATTTKYDEFAQCLSDAGAKFYGAYWCPHCQAQKKMFENSAKLPYIECSTPNGQGQLPVCAEAGIKSYPTWKFTDGSTLEGEQQFTALAEKTSCTAPAT